MIKNNSEVINQITSFMYNAFEIIQIEMVKKGIELDLTLKAIARLGARISKNDENISLHLAIEVNAMEKIKMWINQGANVNASDYRKRSPLHCAAANNKEIMELLISKGAKLNSVDEDGMTPLHYAVIRNSLEAIKYLADKGDALDSLDRYGMEPLLYAITLKRNDLIKVLIAKGAEFTEEIKRCVSDNIGKNFCKKLEDLTPHDKKARKVIIVPLINY